MASGLYTFADLPSGGTYRIKVDVAGTIVEGMTQTVDPDYAGVVCSTCDSQYTTPALVGNLAGINFGYWNGGIVTTPVTLAYFKATEGKGKAKGSVDFEWWTATETGNMGFELFVEAGKDLVLVSLAADPGQGHQHRAGALHLLGEWCRG